MEYLAVIGAAIGLLCAPFLLVRLYARTSAGIFLVLMANMLVPLGFRGEIASFGGISLYPFDVVFGLLSTAILMRVFARGSITYFELLWFGFCVILMISFFRGLGVYGPLIAGEVRPFFYFAVAALYCLSGDISRDEMNAIARLWILFAGALAILGGVDLATDGALSSATRVDLDSRVLHAFYAFQIFQGCLISLYTWAVSGVSPVWRYAGLLMLPVAMMLQYRTVWIVAVVAILLVIVREWRVNQRVAAVAIAGLAGLGLLVLMLLAGLSDNTLSAFSIALAEALSGNSNLLWRLHGWRLIFADFFSFHPDMLIGPPAGTARVLEGVNFLYAHPHNQYITTLLRTGLIGFAIMVVTYVVALRRLRRAPAASPGEMLSGRVLFLLVVCQSVFYLSYDANYEQYLLLGLAVVSTLHRRSNLGPPDRAPRTVPGAPSRRVQIGGRN